MKKLMILAMMVAIATSAAAMTYREAKREALFLADKMAYELNLTDEQYEAAYEINLDYLMAVDSRSHVYGDYWARRNRLLRTIFDPWQYDAYLSAAYFYRPLYWAGNAWQWRIYSRYDRGRFYRSHPVGYVSYRGGRPVRYYESRTWGRPSRAYGYDRGRRHYDGYSYGPRHDNGRRHFGNGGWDNGHHRHHGH